MSDPLVFVLGTGRSGTHFLGYVLESHPQVDMTIEADGIFDLVVGMALDPGLISVLLPDLLARYEAESAQAAPHHYGDKSHPNIWLADRLAEAFPTSKFVGTRRNPYAVVASMFRHSGVMAWHDRWREFPVPNRFLGITEETAGHYEGLTPATKCALRWQSHESRMNELHHLLGDRIQVIEYEQLVLHPELESQRLQIFLDLDEPFPSIETTPSSLEKWRKVLGPGDLVDIEQVTGIAPPE